MHRITSKSTNQTFRQNNSMRVAHKNRIEPSPEPRNSTDKLAVFSADAIHLISFDDIIMIQSEGNYARLILVNGSNLMVSKCLKSVESILGVLFLRVHQSFLVNPVHIKYWENRTTLRLSSGHSARVARSKRASILLHIQSHYPII